MASPVIGVDLSEHQPEFNFQSFKGGGTACMTSGSKTLTFSGYDWTVKSGANIGPGPNNWDENNVWVDEQGELHLSLTSRDGKWYCSQVAMKERLGFGT